MLEKTFTRATIILSMEHELSDEELKKQVEYAINGACSFLEREKIDVTYSLKLREDCV